MNVEHGSEKRPLVLKNKNRHCHTVIYSIQNININVTAEVVAQMNMTPQQVVNHFHDQIVQEIEKAVEQNYTEKDNRE